MSANPASDTLKSPISAVKYSPFYWRCTHYKYLIKISKLNSLEWTLYQYINNNGLRWFFDLTTWMVCADILKFKEVTHTILFLQGVPLIFVYDFQCFHMFVCLQLLKWLRLKQSEVSFLNFYRFFLRVIIATL